MNKHSMSGSAREAASSLHPCSMHGKTWRHGAGHFFSWEVSEVHNYLPKKARCSDAFGTLTDNLLHPLGRSPKAEVPLAFCLSKLGGPEEVLYMLIFPGIITVSVSETHLCVLST
ncbi:hypothetical protein E2C01_031547 [Portunus trituberculatus]|uniref:Uncharacterized protein n=1 Tax=Portunus trituberculatus TaxID=210409 RepID=A0A5B7EXX0_PORTR|nr:hypothetical protein [Portunus trituberculatus]